MHVLYREQQKIDERLEKYTVRHMQERKKFYHACIKSKEKNFYDSPFWELDCVI